MAMWGGRFAEDAAPLFKRFNDSLPFDARLVQQDIQGSIAWAAALGEARVLSEEEVGLLHGALKELAEECARDPRDVAAAGDEDVHGFVERKLIERVGDLGKKLHTGRSRNDQVATDLRLWARQEASDRIAELRGVMLGLVEVAERESGRVLPGYTHLQNAQPVLFGHWCMAYLEMFERDADRLVDAMGRLNHCPLGSGALAGTAYPIDRSALAHSLGFDAPTRNSLDAVSDRDFVLELLQANAVTALHISRLAEDLIVYASEPFGFVRMSDRVTTGSSLMPQKKNPDALELLRGKAGRIVAQPAALAMTLKGLPLAYNKDMQEDKEPLFESMAQLSMCLQVLELVLEGLALNAEVAEEAARRGYTNATDLADYLVEKGIAFRDAHEIVGRIVNRAVEDGVAIEELPIEKLRELDGRIGDDVYDWLTLDAVLERRDVLGGTAPERVRLAIADARSRIEGIQAEIAEVS